MTDCFLFPLYSFFHIAPQVSELGSEETGPTGLFCQLIRMAKVHIFMGSPYSHTCQWLTALVTSSRLSPWETTIAQYYRWDFTTIILPDYLFQSVSCPSESPEWSTFSWSKNECLPWMPPLFDVCSSLVGCNIFLGRLAAHYEWTLSATANRIYLCRFSLEITYNVVVTIWKRGILLPYSYLVPRYLMT